VSIAPQVVQVVGPTACRQCGLRSIGFNLSALGISPAKAARPTIARAAAQAKARQSQPARLASDSDRGALSAVLASRRTAASGARCAARAKTVFWERPPLGSPIPSARCAPHSSIPESRHTIHSPAELLR
jgi:hypothetical protein